MSTTKTSWMDKLNADKQTQLKQIDKKFADIPAGSKMFIATPKIIDEYVRHIPPGKEVSLKTLRNDLAIEHQADYTCPVTTGIFLRIVAEANFEKLQDGALDKDISPFWRVINEKSALAKKLSFGTDFLTERRQKEGIS